MAFSLLSNNPVSGQIAWLDVRLVYDGVDYVIANGTTNKRFVYWQLSAPTVFQTADTLPALGADDTIVFLNKGGVAINVLNATALEGDLVVPGTVTSSAIATDAIVASHIKSDAIIGRHILAGSITADKITVSSLRALTANMGDLTSGSLTIDQTGFVQGGATAYGTGTGFWMGYHGGKYKFRAGTPGSSGFEWNGDGFYVYGPDGSVTISSGVVDWEKIGGSNRPANNATRNVFRGDWAASTSYAVGDIVLKDGNGWSCILAHASTSGNQPPASGSGNTWWTLYAVKGSNGAQGLHALTVLVPNNAHTLPAASDGVVASYTGSGTAIQIFEGTTALSAVSSITANGQFTIGTPTQLPASTITVGARSYSGTTATVAQHSAMAAGTDSVVVTYPITVRRSDGTTVTLSATQTLTKSKTGVKGDAGVNAKAAFLTATSQVFQVAKNGTITPSSITLTATGQNLTGSPAFTVTSGTAALTGTGNARALASNGLTTDAATIKIAWDGQEDFVTIVKVREGADGSSGANAIVAVLSNESHTIPTDSAGNNGVFTGANTTMTIYSGTSDDSANWTVTALASSVTGTLSGKTYTVTGLSADAGYVDLTASRSGYASIVKRFVLTKSKAGPAGSPGSTGAQGPAGPAVVVTANRALSFTATDGALDGSQANIVLTAAVSGIASPTYAWTFSGLQTNPTASTTSSQTITAAQFGTSKSAVVTCTVNGSFVDQVTIVRLEKSTAAPWATAGSNLGTDLSRWEIGSQTLVIVPDGRVGNTVLRLGTAISYPTQTSFVPIDPTKKYRVRFWARPSSNCDGVLYFSLRQAINETGTWGPVNGGRAPYKPSAQTRAAHNATYGTDAWGEYSYIWSAADWQTGVKFFRPEFLNNYNGTAGYWEVQGLVIEEATDVEAAKDAASAAQMSANEANNTLADIASDSKLTPAEKKITKKEWDGIVAEKGGINAQATALGITTENANYNYVYNELNNYITPLLSSLTTTSDIVGSTFRSMFSWFYANRQALLNKIAEVASQLAVWTNITGKPDPQSFLETFESGSVAQWTNYHGAGELSVVSVADSLTGGKVLRIGNNSGNDQAWLIHKQNIPFDPSALYRIKFRVRRTAGTGVVYLGLAGVAADGVTWVNTPGANDIGSQHYVAASNVGPSSTWTEYVGYVKGTAVTGQSGTNPPVTAPLKLHQNVKYIRPLILANHDSVAGTVEVDYCSIELMTDTMNWDGVSGTGKDTLIATASTALTNADAAQAAANNANNTLADIASDNKLTPVEKQSAANEWGIINRERASIQAQASALGISYELNDYNYTYAVLNDYITPLLADLQSPSAIDGPTFRDKWSYFYEYRQRLMNKMSAVAATKADWASVQGSGKPEDGATVGANSSNLRAGVGVNMVFNGDLTDGLAGVDLGWNSGGTVATIGWNLPGYIVSGEGTGYIVKFGGPADGSLFDACFKNGQNMLAVTPGARYEVYAWLNTHRCEAAVNVHWYDANGGYISEVQAPYVYKHSGIQSTADMVQSFQFVTAPANAHQADVRIRARTLGTDPYCFFSRVFFGAAGAGQTEPSPWSPGRGISQITSSNVSTYIANAAIGNAQIGGDIWSTNHVAGSAGWRIYRDGNAEFRNVTVRGDVEASSLKAGVAMVDSLHLKGSAVIIPLQISHGAKNVNLPYSQGVWQHYDLFKYTLNLAGPGLFKFSFSASFYLYKWVGHSNYGSGTVTRTLELYINDELIERFGQATLNNELSVSSIPDKFYSIGAGVKVVRITAGVLMADGGGTASCSSGTVTIQSFQTGSSSV